ncbi:MAG: LysR substrate-binding domain-containing protein [Bacillota bacterium]|jgi:DNA-binding transcriptional LysR family regulator
MEIAQLKTFLTVARHGNLTKAADILHLSQPTVTRQLQRLELWSGMPLFERQGRRTTLTSAGEILHSYAEQVMQALDSCEAAFLDLRKGRRGRLLLGAGLTTTAFTLPEIIWQYKRKLPDIDLSIRTGTTQEILQLVLERQIDIGFVTSPVKHPDCLVTPLYNDDIVLVSDSTLPLAGISISLEELGSLPLILYAPSGFRSFVEDALHRNGVVPRVALELDSIEGIKRMVQANLGYAFVPRSAVAEQLQAGHLVEVPVRGLPPLSRQTSTIRLRSRTPSVATREFLQALAQRWPDAGQNEAAAFGSGEVVQSTDASAVLAG